MEELKSGAREFDAWAQDYERDVRETDARNEYPFAGYSRVLDGMLNLAMDLEPGEALDLGIGTGILSSRLSATGYHLTGLDFSKQMLTLAKKRLPRATLYHADFNELWPEEVEKRSYDLIVSAYAFHHVPNERKVGFLQSLLRHINPQGLIVIGDISFQTNALLNTCRQSCKDSWDDSEDYMVFEDLRPHFRVGQISYQAYSFCAGILKLRHPLLLSGRRT